MTAPPAAPAWPWPGTGGWRVEGWAGVCAGVAARAADPARLIAAFPRRVLVAAAEQVHGASVALVAGPIELGPPIAGCDALLTHCRDVALWIRTADCLPLFFADLARRAVGLAHAGWRGLAACLPARMVAAFRHAYHTRPEELRVAIGPAIRACCYEVGPEFGERFGPFVRRARGRLTCDLIGAAVAQLRASGIRAEHVLDSERCTACEPQRWFSLRREGPAAGRLVSGILMPS